MEDSSRYDLPDSPQSIGWTEARHCVVADSDDPFLTDSGAVLPYVEVEYETYGTPAADGSNCILVCHALSGDAHAAGWDAHWKRDNRPWRKDRPGWWDNVIGPGKGIDTNRWFVICSNVLGGCYGTTGPASVNPETGRPYGLEFPSTPKQGGRMGWSFPSSLSETGCVFKSGCWKSWESRICTR